MPEINQHNYALIFASIDDRLEKIELLTERVITNGIGVFNIEKILKEQARTQTYLVEVIKGNGKTGLAERVNKNCTSIKDLEERNTKEDAAKDKEEEKKEERILKYKDLIIMFIVSNILTGALAAFTSALFK